MHEKHRSQEVIKLIRLSLYNRGMSCGAQVIQRQMQQLGERHIPSVRTIGRILFRQGLTHGRTGIYPGDSAAESAAEDHDNSCC
jgi:hypothetical protein